MIAEDVNDLRSQRLCGVAECRHETVERDGVGSSVYDISGLYKHGVA